MHIPTLIFRFNSPSAVFADICAFFALPLHYASYTPTLYTHTQTPQITHDTQIDLGFGAMVLLFSVCL